MYIRRKKNISGSLSVYILEKQNGKQVLIKSMGAAHTESGISRLENLARKEIERLSKQRVIEFSYDQDEQHKSFIRDSILSISEYSIQPNPEYSVQCNPEYSVQLFWNVFA
jgi:hypothetical protein